MDIIKRYDELNVVNTESGKRNYATVLYPTIEPDPLDIYTVVYESDRLDLLAYKYYGDVRYWWVIAQANSLGKGSFNVNPDTRLRIPKNLDKIVSDYQAINSNR
jgi:hypothetical protein